MAHSYHHAVSSARKFGGIPADYQAVHDWIDGSKQIIADFRHRALRHHAEGCFAAEALFGTTLTKLCRPRDSGASGRRAAHPRRPRPNTVLCGLGAMYPA